MPIRKKGKLPPPGRRRRLRPRVRLRRARDADRAAAGCCSSTTCSRPAARWRASAALSRQAGYACSGIGVLLDLGIAPGFRCGGFVGPLGPRSTADARMNAARPGAGRAAPRSPSSSSPSCSTCWRSGMIDPGAAAPDRGLPRRRHRAAPPEVYGVLRHGLGADAVLLDAGRWARCRIASAAGPSILLSNLGLGLDYVLMALAPKLAWLFVGRVISGITAASISTAHGLRRRRHAAGAACRSFRPDRRRVRHRLRARAGDRRPARAASIRACRSGSAAAFSLANAAYGYFVLPESLPPERRRPFEWRRANPLGSLQLAALAPASWPGSPASSFLSNLAHAALPADVRAVRGLPLRLGRAGRRASRSRSSASARRSCRGRSSGRWCAGSASGAS